MLINVIGLCEVAKAFGDQPLVGCWAKFAFDNLVTEEAYYGYLLL